MKRQLLFLLTILLASAPACKQKNKPNLAGAHGAIAAGTILTTGGTVGVPLATVFALEVARSSASTLLAIFITPPAALLIIGIPLIIYGVKKRKTKIKKFKERQKLEIEKVADQENKILEENLSTQD